MTRYILSLLLVLAAGMAQAGELPPRFVVLDELSPNLALVQAVAGANQTQLSTLMIGEAASTDGSRETSPVGVLQSLVQDAKATGAYTNAALAAPDIYNLDPIVAAVAAQLDLEAGAFVTGYPETVLATGIIVPRTPTTPTLPVLDGNGEGYCKVPAIATYPSYTNSLGGNIRRPHAGIKIDTSICQVSVASKKELRKYRKKNLEKRATRQGQGLFFTGPEAQDDSQFPATEGYPGEQTAPTSTTASTSSTTGSVLVPFYGCGSHFHGCDDTGRVPNFHAYLNSKLLAPLLPNFIQTSAVAQTYWWWSGYIAPCANVGGIQWNRVYADGPDEIDVKFEGRVCDWQRGENCTVAGTVCPMAWFASTRAPNITFDLWAFTASFHRLHWWLPKETPIASGVFHTLYHWHTAEYVVEPSKGFWKGIACLHGGDYGRGYPWYLFADCYANSGPGTSF